MSTSKKSIKFPYKYKTLDFGQIPDPTIKIPILSKKGWEVIKFLVDSGADVTTLPLELASYLLYPPNMNKKIHIEGVEGNAVAGYPGKIKVKIGQYELLLRCYFIESDVIPLLGRLDIWNKFTIIFDNMKKEVVFRKI